MDKKLIVQKDIEELIRSGAASLAIDKGTIVTPLAAELAASSGITISYRGEPMQNSAAPQSYNIKDYPASLILKFYYLMLKIRLFEELVKSYKENNLIPGVMVHSYIGQEAIAVGVCAALTGSDFLTSTHRGHGHLIAKGADISKMLAEILGKSGGYCRGKGGSMHITDIGLGILGANGIVGAGLPIACGSALASKLAGDNLVTVSFFGDGASNQGTFGESLNFSKIFSLAVLFMCENNGYAVSTPISYGCGSEHIYKRGLGYDVDSHLINGDDVFEVYASCSKHIESMRGRPHPVLIEATTHRHIGHWVGDPQKYRDQSELANLSSYDPLGVFLSRVKARPDITGESLRQVELKVQAELSAAASFANGSPYPSTGEATKDYIKE
jgi:acetoin:2,6-dichlorophenolindophenol oxidoreductase subunit alpha